MTRRYSGTGLALLLLLLAGVHHPVVHAGTPPGRAREARIFWHYPQARLRVDCGLPPGTVVSSVTLPLPAGVPAGLSRLSRAGEADLAWTLMPTSLPGLSVRAVLDNNGLLTGDGTAPQTALRLELLTDGPVHAGWLTVPPPDLGWHVYDPDTRALLWRGRIGWKGRLKIDTEGAYGPTAEENACR